jgi:hypothetical protein
MLNDERYGQWRSCSFSQAKGASMLERIKKLLEQLLIPQRPMPAPVPVRPARRSR